MFRAIYQTFIEMWKKHLFCIIYAIVILVIYNASHDRWDLILYYSDGLFIAGFSLICFGLLSILNYFGAYDIFQHMVAKRGANGVKPSLYEFSEQKRIERKKNKLVFLPYIFVGVILVLISMLLLIFI